jgi:stearoyl-CoA desaturase (delta-9 desaturase)
MALWGAAAVQRGALWWAYNHRHHHQHSDEPDDKHSPVQHGFWWAHIGWITSKRNFPTDYSKVPDLAKYPELVFLNRFDVLVPAIFGVACYGFGAGLAYAGVETSGWQMLVWAFFISTTVLFHGTACINSMAHVWGKRRFNTKDDSRNSWILTLITLGEGWHNNHHRYQATTRQGFYWWEFDPTYYFLRALSWTGLIWGLKSVPESIYAEAQALRAKEGFGS